MNRPCISIGWAQTDITPDRPVYVQGQLYHRISSYVKDPLTATALAFQSGDEQAVFLSADIAGFSDPLLEAVRAKLKKNTVGLDVTKVNFSGTHTHNSIEFSPGVSVFELILGRNFIPEDRMPQVKYPDNYLYGEEGMQWLSSQLADVVLDAWVSRQDGAVATAHDYACVGHNRRPQFMANGKRETRMYGTCSEDCFVGMENSVDHTANFLFTWDAYRNLTGILAAIPCPSQVHELHCYLTADYWKDAREQLRQEFGDIFVLPLCAFAGDQNPLDLVQISKYNEEEFKIWNAQSGEVLRNVDLSQVCRDIGERITEAARHAYRTARIAMEARPELKHDVSQIRLPVRCVTEDDYIQAQKALDEMIEKFSPEAPMTWPDVAAAFPYAGVVGRWERQNADPYWTLETHAIRLGRAVFVTTPSEMFVEYGFRVRARCVADEVFPIQLSNGMYGYVPTEAAVAGGSYSGQPASTPLSPDGGSQLTEHLIRHANALFGK